MKLFNTKSVHGLFLIGLLIYTFAAPQSAFAEDAAPQHQSTILQCNQLYGGTPLVHLRLNDTDVTFILDLGCSLTFVSDSLVKKLNLKVQPAVMNTGEPLMFQGKQPQQAIVDRFAIGDFVMTNAPLVVIDNKQFIAMDKPVDGIIGTDYLYYTALLFDFTKHQITAIAPGGLSADDIKKMGFDNAAVLPLTQNQYRLYTLPSTISNGKDKIDSDLTLDTGSASTIISSEAAKKLKLKQISSREAVTLYGLRTTLNAKLHSLQLGDIKMNDLIVAYREKEDSVFTNLLGMNVLSGYRILFDPQAKKLYLQPNPSPAPAASNLPPDAVGAGTPK